MFFSHGLQPSDVNVNWFQSVWNLPTAPKVKMLIWKAAKGALPVSARLVERHINVEPVCKRRGAIESIPHLFFQCKFASDVWEAAPFTQRKDRIFGLLESCKTSTLFVSVYLTLA